VIANLNLHTGLAEVDIAPVMQFKVHQIPHDPVKPVPIAYECGKDPRFRTIQACPKDLRVPSGATLACGKLAQRVPRGSLWPT
jgi:hypothetical protein